MCTLSGSTVSYAAAGFCVIDANQAGNGTYAAAAQAQQTITVNGKPPAVTGVSPSSGACQAATVTTHRNRPDRSTSVSFGSVSAKFTVNSSTQITATSPADPNNASYVDITVTTPSGTSAVTQQDQFGYNCDT